MLFSRAIHSGDNGDCDLFGLVIKEGHLCLVVQITC